MKKMLKRRNEKQIIENDITKDKLNTRINNLIIEKIGLENRIIKLEQQVRLKSAVNKLQKKEIQKKYKSNQTR